MQKLFDKQLKLDDIILTNLCKRIGYEMTHRSLINQRMLALYTEIGEFVEEKEPIKKRTEYIDCIHFLLSIGNTLEITYNLEKHSFNDIYMQTEKGIYEKDVINLMQQMAKFSNASQVFKYWKIRREPKPNLEKHYINLVMTFLNLGKTMGYEAIEIINCYSEKWEENVSRQKNKY